MKCWEAWDTTCGHKVKDITPLITWRREALEEEAFQWFLWLTMALSRPFKEDSLYLPWKDERGPSSIRRTLELFQRQRWGNFWETGWSASGLFRAHRNHVELNWTEPNSQTQRLCAMYKYESDDWNQHCSEIRSLGLLTQARKRRRTTERSCRSPQRQSEATAQGQASFVPPV